jgi:L-lysine exporter family protein LysE/ArgO
MEAFLSGMLFGYGASVPIGPVNVLIMANALRGFRYGFAVGLGAASVDVVYLILASFGVLALLNSDVFMTVLGTFGAGFLLYIAWLTWKGADKLAGQAEVSNLTSRDCKAAPCDRGTDAPLDLSKETVRDGARTEFSGSQTSEDNSNLKKDSGVATCYLKGFLLNAVNPYIIGFWLSVASFAAQTGDVKTSVAGLIFAIFTWIFGLSWVVAKSRRFIGGAVARWFAYISAALIAFFAFYIAYNTFFGSRV